MKKVHVTLFLILLVLAGAIYMYSRKENFYLQPMNYETIQKPKKTQINQEETFFNSPAGYHGNFPLLYPNTPSYVPQVDVTPPYAYPNTKLPPSVIGCGGRRGACMGGTQIPIPNTLPPVNISDMNIAPVNLTMRGFDEGLQQVGTIQKVFGDDNFVYPLFGRKRYRNDNKWDYFVKFGKYGVILPVWQRRNYEELNTNDEVRIEGQKHKYRVTIYEEDIPQYLPFS